MEYSNLYNDVSARIVDYQPQRIENKNKVEFFTDRVEILSPGGLYGGVSLEDILSGRQITRNPGIANILGL